MHRILLTSLLIIGLSAVQAQELNCKVSIITNINTDVTSAENEIFKQIQQVITDFMNNTKWTDDKFKVEERINCQLQLQINTINNGHYTGSLQVQSTRPVFNGSYNTTVFNFQDDDFEFDYSRNTIVIYQENQFRDNLSSMLAFYAYFIIGMDYDTFSDQGGTPYFQVAQQIVSNAQGSGAKGWKSNEQGKRNRYWLTENIMQQLFVPLRQCLYSYHRKGLDHLYEDKAKARAEIYNALNGLSTVSSARPNTINIINFAECKRNELKNLYSDATVEEKNQIVAVLKKIDPANSTKYEAILN